MTPSIVIAVLTLLGVMLFMAGEAWLSARNERMLRMRGAVEPVRDVYDTMRWAYPASFVAMALEGALIGPSPSAGFVAGLAVLGLSKALKIWAISTLGVRWTYKVFILPDAPLIARGPYAFMRHPNYLAVVGELIGMALTVGAPRIGIVALLGFGTLLRRRITLEDRALGRK
jgi:methyltransferase